MEAADGVALVRALAQFRAQPDHALAELVLLGARQRALQPEQIKAYNLAFERLLGSALGPRQTLELIDEVRRDLH